MSLPEATEAPHFDKSSFRIGKKIFATLNIPANRVCVKLSVTNQDLFSTFDQTIIYPVPNKWGKQGWTLVNLANVPGETLTDALTWRK
ncbi:MAG: MmcQ/YjbR family DNA-binding protein [Rudanella sp.]|nr:MmcQ/YjbR family DNA-binding protein [Rudanella sp.]